MINGEHGDLDFLYVKSGTQSKGIGQRIWNAIEEKHPGRYDTSLATNSCV
jgi:hypothetical protein